MVYEYEGMRTFESLKAFIKQDHIYIQKQYEIPPHIGLFGLYMRYLERDLPRYEAIADEHVFSKLGLDKELSGDEKFIYVVGAALLLLVTLLTTLCCLCCCCCKKSKKQVQSGESAKKPASRSTRQKVD